MTCAAVGNENIAGLGVRLRRFLRRRLISWLARPSHDLRSSARNRYDATILKVDRLGDFILAIPAIRLILKRYGENKCLLIISVHVVGLVRELFPRTAYLVVPAFLGHGKTLFAEKQIRRMLRGIDPGRCVSLRHQRTDYDDLLITWLSPDVCVRSSLSGSCFNIGTDQRLYISDITGEVVLNDVDLAISPGDPVVPREIFLHRAITEVFLCESITLTHMTPYLDGDEPGAGIIISPKGSDPIRDIPINLIEYAVREAHRFWKGPITFLGDSRQADSLHEIAARCREWGFPAEVETSLGLPGYIDKVASAGLVITAETATAHVAAAANRRALIFIGGGHFGQYGPWRRSARQVWITKVVDCFGCDWRCVHSEPYCLTKIGFEAVRRALAEIGTAA